jgi:hypothetical protein
MVYQYYCILQYAGNCKRGESLRRLSDVQSQSSGRQIPVYATVAQRPLTAQRRERLLVYGRTPSACLPGTVATSAVRFCPSAPSALPTTAPFSEDSPPKARMQPHIGCCSFRDENLTEAITGEFPCPSGHSRQGCTNSKRCAHRPQMHTPSSPWEQGMPCHAGSCDNPRLGHSEPAAWTKQQPPFALDSQTSTPKLHTINGLSAFHAPLTSQQQQPKYDAHKIGVQQEATFQGHKQHHRFLLDRPPYTNGSLDTMARSADPGTVQPAHRDADSQRVKHLPQTYCEQPDQQFASRNNARVGRELETRANLTRKTCAGMARAPRHSSPVMLPIIGKSGRDTLSSSHMPVCAVAGMDVQSPMCISSNTCNLSGPDVHTQGTLETIDKGPGLVKGTECCERSLKSMASEHCAPWQGHYHSRTAQHKHHSISAAAHNGRGATVLDGKMEQGSGLMHRDQRVRRECVDELLLPDTAGHTVPTWASSQDGKPWSNCTAFGSLLWGHTAPPTKACGGSAGRAAMSADNTVLVHAESSRLSDKGGATKHGRALGGCSSRIAGLKRCEATDNRAVMRFGGAVAGRNGSCAQSDVCRTLLEQAVHCQGADLELAHCLAPDRAAKSTGFKGCDRQSLRHAGELQAGAAQKSTLQSGRVRNLSCGPSCDSLGVRSLKNANNPSQGGRTCPVAAVWR